MTLNNWLQEVVQNGVLEEDALSYLLSRGARQETLDRMGLFTWRSSGLSSAPEDSFSKKYGARGERLEGMVVTPVYSPLERILGIECRAIDQKKNLKHYLPQAKWNPVWVGLRNRMEAIWNGATIWIVEGIFDLFALEWVVDTRRENVVLSSSRAGLTRNHVNFLARYAHGGVRFVYDNDEAGRNALMGYDHEGRWTPGVLNTLKKRGVPNVSHIRYTDKDPGEVWSKGGRDRMREVFSHIVLHQG